MIDLSEITTYQWIVLVLYLLFITPITYFEYTVYLRRMSCAEMYNEQIQEFYDKYPGLLEFNDNGVVLKNVVLTTANNTNSSYHNIIIS